MYNDPTGHSGQVYCNDPDGEGLCAHANLKTGTATGTFATIGIQDFISNPMKYVEFYADADEWAYNPLVVNLKRFAENTLHIYAESLLFDYVGENYGTEGLEELDKAHLANILDPGSYDLDLSGYALTVSYFEQQNSSLSRQTILNLITGGSLIVIGAVGGNNQNIIGNNGVKSVANQLGIEMNQIDIGGRRYDGYDPISGLYLEVKTTTRGTVYPNSAIRLEIANDYNGNVMWIFVDGKPSLSLGKMLTVSNIPWIEWYR